MSPKNMIFPHLFAAPGWPKIDPFNSSRGQQELEACRESLAVVDDLIMRKTGEVMPPTPLSQVNETWIDVPAADNTFGPITRRDSARRHSDSAHSNLIVAERQAS